VDVIGAVLVSCSDGAFFYRVTELPDPKHIPDTSKQLGGTEKSNDLGLGLFVKSAEHPCGGQLISELIAKEGFTRLKDDGTLLKAKAFDKRVAYFGICPDFVSFPEMKRAKAIAQLRASRKSGKMFVVHRIASGWGMTLVVHKKK
jgi:hypothetical protein|tara:strand:- start:2596 stop:3030 length:435 start_codon:yes stop_codon:yes gene_type:complete